MPGIARSHNKQNRYISIFKNAYSNPTLHVGLPFTKPHEHLVQRSGEITLQTKIYLHWLHVYGDQTWQSGHLSWRVSIHKDAWPFSHMVLQDHVPNQDHWISTTTTFMANKLGRVETDKEEHQRKKLHGTLITYLERSCEKLNILHLQLH